LIEGKDSVFNMLPYVHTYIGAVKGFKVDLICLPPTAALRNPRPYQHRDPSPYLVSNPPMAC